MNIVLKTPVKGNYKEVMKRFDRDLFEVLLPKQGEVKIQEFTGSKKGDRVHLKFISPIKTEWVSDITEDGEDDQSSYFIDEGTQLPFPLTYWKHKHIVEKISEQESLIIDDISFKAGNPIFTLLLYPAIYLGFFPRKKIYKRYFNPS